MNTKNETYMQKSFFQTGMPFFVAALFFLAAAFYCSLRRTLLFPAVSLLVIGFLLIMLGVGKVKRETKSILRFVQEKSILRHRCSPPLTIAGLLNCLKQEGFEVTEYSFGNYYCYRYIDQKYRCHFFVANNDTPDCPEAESYSELFIQRVYESELAAGCQYLLDLEYGFGLEQKSPQYIQAVREGFMHDKHGIPFGFRLAYDTQEDILYCAEAVTRIIWQKNEVFASYISALLKKLLKICKEEKPKEID